MIVELRNVELFGDAKNLAFVTYYDSSSSRAYDVKVAKNGHVIGVRGSKCDAAGKRISNSYRVRSEKLHDWLVKSALQDAFA